MTFDERLATLQTLFVQRAEIDARLRELLDGTEPSVETEKPTRTYHRKGKRKRLAEEDKQAIVAAINAGKSNKEIIKEYGISYPTVMRLKNSAQKKRKILGYRCLGCGHTFKSNLSKLDAYCPQPGCNKATDIEEVQP